MSWTPDLGVGNEFDVALSFASEQRWYVDVVARCLQDAGVRAFYDAFESSRVWGRDGIELFTELYSQAFRVVMFVSREYVDKAWPSVERRAALSRLLNDPNANHILPVRFDEAEVPGLPAQRIYQSASSTSPTELANLLLKHLVHVGRCSPSVLEVAGMAESRARRIAFSSIADPREDFVAVKYRVHNGSDSVIDGVVVVVADPGEPECSPDDQMGCAMELVLGTVAPGDTVEDVIDVQLDVEPTFVELPYLATLLWTDVDDNHWSACGPELRRRTSRARTC